MIRIMSALFMLMALASLALAAPEVEIVRASDVNWEHLNPARGAKSPSAGTLWGDRNGTGATGFLLRPTDGFESPPHIHNVSYRAIVISGLIHNDDPEAADMWLPAGSFWTQPKGEVHITAARGSDTMAYVEIDSGPYLVLPSHEAFDSGERPVNVDESNVVWVSGDDVTWIDQGGPQVAYLWGTPQGDSLHGMFVKLPAGQVATLQSSGSTFRAVVIQGQVQHGAEQLDTGSYFGSQGNTSHQLSADAETILYVRTDGAVDITAEPHTKETTMPKLTIVASILAKPEHVDLVKSELLKLIDITRAEDGCLQYDLHQDNEDPAHFLFYENWENRELWQQHMNAQHLADYLKATDGAVAEFTVHEMTRID